MSTRSSGLARCSRSLRQASVAAVVPLVLCTGLARAQNAGWLGPSYAGAETVPTGARPESKLWWNDGIWWGCLWSAQAQSYTIHRLLVGTQTWHDTGTAVDPRPKSRADCLWDGAKLYVASHQYTDGIGAPGNALMLYRYSFDPNLDRYGLDVGFPTLIGDAKTETLVIDKDSTGTLWAVWMAGLRIWTAHTVGDDRSWSAPVVHPRSTSDLAEDDVAALVAVRPVSGVGSGTPPLAEHGLDPDVSLRRGAVGVLWSDQVREAFYFTFHEDGAPADSWSPVETVLAGPLIAEDDIALRAARDGRIFAAVETNTDEVRLEVRSPTGGWTDHLVSADADDWCRPIVVLDEGSRTVHVFGTSPVSIGSIHEKTSPMDAIAFAPGAGTPVIRDASTPAVNDASSTKQSVDGTTGLVVLASHQTLQRYVHHHHTLGGHRPSAPGAAFHASAGESFTPVSVQFLDASTGRPTAWAWSFGDGATSTQRHPVHTYAQPGEYTVSLNVTNALGTSALTRRELVRVESAPASLVLRPIADGHAFEGQPASNYGGLGLIRLRGDREPDFRAFLKFFVPPGVGSVVSAELALVCIDNAQDGGTVYRVSDDWEEPTLSWGDMPALGGSPLGTYGDPDPGQTLVMSVGAAVSGSGTVSFGLSSSDFHSVSYGSRECATPPELRLGFAQLASAPPQAGFESNRRVGSAPLTVQFFDASSGRVDSWSWDFGDGATSDLQNPSHVYARPGRYVVSLTVTNANGASTLGGPEPIRVGTTASLPTQAR